MKLLRITAMLALAGLMAGCFKFEVKVPSFGGEGSSDESAPTQLPTGGWKDIAAGALGQILTAEDGILFFAYDTLAYPNAPAALTAKLLSVRSMKPKGVKGATIGFYYDGELLGTAKTDANGGARITFTPQAAGNYNFDVEVIAALKEGEYIPRLASAPLLLAARDKSARLAVIDLDHTLVDSGFIRVLIGGARRMADSVEVTNRIAQTHTIVYLTDRPDLLTRKSKTWLARNGYPPGPVLLSTVSKVFSGAGQFKTDKLTDIRKAYPNVAIGIGDKPSDAQAYVDNRLTAFLIPHYKDKPGSLRDKADQIGRVRGRGRLNVVSNWRQIEAGIFAKKKYPPKPFVTSLRRRADRLEAAKRARKRREKEDDDDD